MMARLAYECNIETRLANISGVNEIVRPFACTAEKYCLYCCCSPQCCLVIQRKPPKHFWEAWYFWLGIALIVLFIISSVSTYVVSNCRHNLQNVTVDSHTSRDNRRPNFNPDNQISIHVIPTAGLMPPVHRKMVLYAPQASASHMTPIVA